MKVWKSEEIFHSGDEYFRALKKAISGAHAAVDLEAYIFEPDHIGKEITLLLQETAQRGVLVRLMVDGVGAINYDPQTFVKTLDPYFQVRVFRPVLLRFFKWRRSRRSLIDRFFHWLRITNHRNHRKVCIIDAKIAFVGSINISAVHSEHLSGAKAWRDTAIRVEGFQVGFLTEAFERTWRKATRFGGPRKWVRTGIFRRLTRPRGEPELVRLNDPFYRREAHYRNLLGRISQATQRVWMTSAYFVPDLSLLRALRLAAWTGSQVQVLVSRKTDLWIFRWVTPVFYYFLVKAGVRIFEYTPRVLHAKTLLVDDWALVGSSNMNHRTLLHDLEVDIVSTQEHSRKELEKQFLKDLEDSTEITIATLRRRSAIARVIGKFALIVRRWI